MTNQLRTNVYNNIIVHYESRTKSYLFSKINHYNEDAPEDYKIIPKDIYEFFEEMEFRFDENTMTSDISENKREAMKGWLSQDLGINNHVNYFKDVNLKFTYQFFTK